MTEFDFDKILAKVEGDMDAEQRARISAAVSEAADTAIAKTKAGTDRIADEVINKRAATLSKFETKQKQAQSDLDDLRVTLSAVRSALEHRTDAAIARLHALETQKTGALEARFRSLNAAERFERLAWADLPVKIAAVIALIIGIIIGASATVFIAADRKADIETQQALTASTVHAMQNSINHWEATAGFRLGTHRSRQVVILDEGQRFKRYVPPIGAIDAGNLWVVTD